MKYLPATHEGVFFLSNGFPQCVAINTGQDLSRIHPDDVPENARVFTWSDAANSLIEINAPTR